MSAIEFVKQVSSGDAGSAKDTLTNMISNLAFEALDGKKKEVAGSMFNDKENNTEE